jgi:osmoprotectant transport system substrate-binding protein
VLRLRVSSADQPPPISSNRHVGAQHCCARSARTSTPPRNPNRFRRSAPVVLFLLTIAIFNSACHQPAQPHLVVTSKFFTEQVILAELLAQHIEARTGIHVIRKSNLGGTLLVHKALLNGDVDLYVEYTGTALTGVLAEAPQGDSAAIYRRVREEYAQRFALEVTEPLGFANSFAMVVRGDDARNNHLVKMSDIAPLAPRWRAGVGYEFLERPDGYRGWTESYGLKFGKTPSVLDLGLVYRALAEKNVDIVAGNSTDGLIDALGFVALQDDRHYFPPYDAVPIVRRAALEKFPQLRPALADLAGKISEEEMRRLNREVDADQRDVAAVVREFRASKGL